MLEQIQNHLMSIKDKIYKRFWSHRFLGMLVLTSMMTISCANISSAERQTRLSGGVVFPKNTPEHINFIENPGVGYVEAYFRFGSDMPDDAIIFVDQELLEGIKNPRWVKGGDWMSFVGIQRSGAVWVGGGQTGDLKYKPSKDRNWVIKDLKQRLEHDVWYKMRIVTNFAQLEFLSVTIVGGQINQTFDLSGIPLDYPNYMPFDRASMIYIPGIMRGRSMMQREGKPVVYFDDLEGGILLPDGKQITLIFEDFEDQTDVHVQPVTWPIISLDNYQTERWYYERDESIFRIEQSPFARSGNRVAVADANLNP